MLMDSLRTRQSCVAQTSRIVCSMLPDLRNAEAFFAWTVDVHNAVNVLLRKSTLEFATAAVLWAHSAASLTDPEVPAPAG